MPLVPFNVRVDPEIYKRAEALAKARGCSIADLMREGLTIVVDRPGEIPKNPDSLVRDINRIHFGQLTALEDLLLRVIGIVAEERRRHGKKSV